MMNGRRPSRYWCRSKRQNDQYAGSKWRVSEASRRSHGAAVLVQAVPHGRQVEAPGGVLHVDAGDLVEAERDVVPARGSIAASALLNRHGRLKREPLGRGTRWMWRFAGRAAASHSWA